MGKIKINLNAIKTDNTLDSVLPNTNTSIIKVNKPMQNTESPPEKKLEKEKPINTNKKTLVNKKIGLNSIKKDTIKLEKTKAPPEKAEEKLEKTKAPPEKAKKPIFKNYESIFKKDKTSILNHIKRLKQIPKTNIILLTVLISITIAGIGFLFSTNPKVHNLDNYKTSILDTYNAVSNKNISGSGSISNKNIKKIINKGGYIYNIEIKNILGKDIYIYNGKYYENLDKLNIVIDKETDNSKQVKLVKILKNSFSK